MAIIDGAYKKTSNMSSEGILKIDVHDTLFHIGDPSETPIVACLGGMIYENGAASPKKVEGKIKTEELQSLEYKVVEKDMRPRKGVVASAVASTTTEAITFTDASMFRVGDTLKNATQANGEVVYVHTIAGNVVTVRRNIGGTTFQIAANDVFNIVGFSTKQGGSKPKIKSQLAAPRSRFAQIYKTAYGITNTALAVAIETSKVSVEDEESAQAMTDHKRDMALSFWFNPAADSTTDADSNIVYLSRGFIAEMTTSGNFTTAASASMTEDYFFGEFSAKVFSVGGQRKQFAVNSNFKSLINSWGRTKLNTTFKDTAYGFKIEEIETPHGTYEMFTDGALNTCLPQKNGATNLLYGAAMVFDLIKFRPIKGRNTSVQSNTQTPGDDVSESQIVTEAGFSIRGLPAHHFVYTT